MTLGIAKTTHESHFSWALDPRRDESIVVPGVARAERARPPTAIRARQWRNLRLRRPRHSRPSQHCTGM